VQVDAMILNNFLSDAALKEHPVCHSHPPQFDVAGWHKPGAQLDYTEEL
jgi:hypothetical protein